MSRPQTIDEALSDLPSNNPDAFSKLDAQVHHSRRPLLRTKLRPASDKDKERGINGTREEKKEDDDATMRDADADDDNAAPPPSSGKARFEKYAGAWNPVRRTAWSEQRSANRNVKEAVLADGGELVQSVEFDSTPHNPFLEARSSAVVRFTDTTHSGRTTAATTATTTTGRRLDADFLEEEEDSGEDEVRGRGGIDPSFLEADESTPEPTTTSSSRRHKRTHSNQNDDVEDVDVLPASFLAFAKESMGRSVFSSPSKRRKMAPADFALLWQKSGRGGVSNRMIVAQQAFLAGEDLEEGKRKEEDDEDGGGGHHHSKKIKKKGKEPADTGGGGAKKGKSHSQKQMDRLLGGKRR